MPLSPEDADTLFDAITDALGRGEREAAIRLADAALAQGLDEPLVLLLTAEARQEQGRDHDALALLRQAADIAPEEPEVWYALGTVLVRLSQDDEGLAALETALRERPDMLPALRHAGAVAFRIGHLTDAETHYRRAVALAPNDVGSLAALAALAARRGDPEAARRLAEQALALQPDTVSAELALGRADLSERLSADTAARMDRLLARRDLDDDAQVAALDLRAEARDAGGHAASAFEDYAARNAILRRANASRFTRDLPERRIDEARRLTRYFGALPMAWQPITEPDLAGARAAGAHLFLLGFPRSGTTLIEKVLASHPAVVTLEEVDHLGAVGRHWLADDAGLMALERMTPGQAIQPREEYWARVRQSVGRDLAGMVVLDKLPLHSLALPVIARLFPAARILFAIRDPRDVVLSCFRRRFRINAAMFEFLDLADAARYYDAVMGLTASYRSLLPLMVHDVRHETVVRDFRSSVEAILDFAGLRWDPSVTGFAGNLPADPRTPSDVQLRRGLQADGVGQWRRYRAEMTPVLDLLAPWVRHFDYPED